MTKRTSIALLLFAGSALTAPAFADTLRCGSSLISTGAVAAYVVQKCGAPDAKQEVTEPVMARRPDGFVYQTGTTTHEIWRYQRGSRQFPAILTFEGGVLKKLEFEK